MSGNGQRRKFFNSFFYSFAGFLFLYSAYLFLSNVDQLFVTEAAIQTREVTEVWGDDREILNQFAGGFWKDVYFWKSLNLTLATTLITTFIATILGIPTAYALSRYRIPGKSVVEILFSSLIVMPGSVIGICLIVMFNYGPLWELQNWLGFKFAHSIFPGMVIASLVLSFAFGMSAWKATFDSVNPRFEQVARTLGSSRWRAFKTTTLPLAKSGIVTGIILAWTRAMAEFSAVLFFCGTFRELPASRFSDFTKLLQMDQADWVSVAVWAQVEFGNIEYGFALAFVLVIIGGISVYVMHRIGAKGYVW
ncbi:ABC transporter permease subunit [uncultured Desulfosarcina sp.]|uniref:molybdate ABC transporter permease subunit n=1 Tax=uncultured Desulfosarcina sp. TaxID=218289 RepID=UPI0029C86D48|nr:ABC transporter permease subunit [uncultured Desulfosarcina sp.]